MFIFATLLGLAGNTMILIMAVIYGFFTDFTHINSSILGWIFGLYTLGELWGFVVGYLGIRREKISYPKVFLIGVGTFFGGILGSFVTPLFGSIIGAGIGAFLVAFLVEMVTHQGPKRALHVACIAAIMQLFCLFGKMFIATIMMFILIWNLPW